MWSYIRTIACSQDIVAKICWCKIIRSKIYVAKRLPLSLVMNFWIYQVAHKKCPQFSALEKTRSKPRQNCFGSWMEHCLHFTYLSLVTRTVTLILWRLPCCVNVADSIQATTSSSRKTVFRHATQKGRNSFYDTTLQTSYLLWMGITFSSC